MTVVVVAVAIALLLALGVGGFLVSRSRRGPGRADDMGSAKTAAGAGTAVLERPAEPTPAEQAIPATEGLAGRIRSLFSRGITEDTWTGLEDALIRADVGATAAADVVQRVRASYRLGTDPAELVSDEVEAMFASDRSWESPEGSPAVVMVVGVNGTGKTTTIGKLAHLLREGGRKVTLAASDTFRAAAGEQLDTWAQRSGAHVVSQNRGADPGAVAFDAVQAARARGDDVVIVDTAGRLHTREPLMQELAKVRRVLEKAAGRVDEVLLVLDATTGQNGIAQARAFTEAVDVTGVVLSKMDGTARGGIVLAVREELGVPVKLVGTGERIQDLAPFDARAFARRLVA
jgi:fused signal recognition particle receptor